MTDRKRDPLPEGYQFGDALAEHDDFARIPSPRRLALIRSMREMREPKPFDTDSDTGDEA